MFLSLGSMVLTVNARRKLEMFLGKSLSGRELLL